MRIKKIVPAIVMAALLVQAVPASAQEATFSLPTWTEIWSWLTGTEEVSTTPEQCSLACQIKTDAAVGECRGNVDEAVLARANRPLPAADCRLRAFENYEACMVTCGTPVPRALTERRIAARQSGVTPEQIQALLRGRRSAKP